MPRHTLAPLPRAFAGHRDPLARRQAIASDDGIWQRLDRIQVLGNDTEGHDGCVNALSWSDDGSILLSGSDDQRICIWSSSPSSPSSRADSSSYSPYVGRYPGAQSATSPHPMHLVETIATGHRANIFSARFLPNASTPTVVSCAGDREIRVIEVERLERVDRASHRSLDPGESDDWRYYSPMERSSKSRTELNGQSGVRVLRCHKDRTKRIATENSPFLFLSVSEDGTVRQHDLRRPHRCRSECPEPLFYTSGGLDLYSLSVSRVTPHMFAVAGRHSSAFVCDRRMPSRQVPSWGPAHRSVTAGQVSCVRRLGLPEDTWADYPRRGQRNFFADDSHITCVKMSPERADEVICAFARHSTGLFSLYDDPAGENMHVEGEVVSGDTGGKRDAGRRHSRSRSAPSSASRSAPKDASRRHGRFGGHGADEGAPGQRDGQPIRSKSGKTGDPIAISQDPVVHPRTPTPPEDPHKKGQYSAEDFLRSPVSKAKRRFSDASGNPSPRGVARTQSEPPDAASEGPEGPRETFSITPDRIASVDGTFDRIASNPEIDADEDLGQEIDLAAFRGLAHDIAGIVVDADQSENEDMLGMEGDFADHDDFEDEDDFEDDEELDSDDPDGIDYFDDEDGDEDVETENVEMRGSGPSGSLAFSAVPLIHPRRTFKGARNVETVKDCNFLGARADKVCSGSDDGNFFVWDKETGRLEGIWEGDGRIVNQVEQHPSLPIVAVSGIDSTVKIFGPTQGDRLERSFSRMHLRDRIIRANTAVPMYPSGGFARASLMDFFAQRGIQVAGMEEDDDGEGDGVQCATQ